MEVSTPQGSMRMWFTGGYKEVLENHRLVYTESMADEHGIVAPASDGVGSHPATTEVRVEFQDIGGRTRMVLMHIGIADGSPGAIGWQMALDKLAIHVQPHRAIQVSEGGAAR
jgi:uncharacterized protein YndB with AHSA1/START domain